ncbi:hypothetical protein MD484_g5150, partial [Candolleomyces efflorescens]
MSFEPSNTSDVLQMGGLRMRMKDDIDRMFDLAITASAVGEGNQPKDESESSPREVKRIVILIDGDGAIFDLDLIAKGIPGGHEAGMKLEAGVMKHIHRHGVQEGYQYQLWAYIFLDKHGVTKALRYSPTGKPEAAGALSEFMVGFCQANERFMVIDVGGEKEAADAKITGSFPPHYEGLALIAFVALMEAELWLPETEKIIFAGTHDGGYKAILRSHITSGYKDKLALLETYDEDASRFSELGLDIFAIENLFTPEKVVKPEPLSDILRLCKCKYHHDYELNSLEIEDLRAHLKKSEPCRARNKGKVCPEGEECLFAHKCPYMSGCRYLKANRCKFKGEDMHVPEKLRADDTDAAPNN